MKPKMTRSSGNVFTDLCFPSQEAEHLRIRSLLIVHLRRLIEARGLNQSQAAKLFGVTQPRVSDLVQGKIDLFSIMPSSTCSPEPAFASNSPYLPPSVNCASPNG